MPLNEWVDDLPAGQASPAFHPDRNAALLHADQCITHHKTVASGATHGVLLCRDGISSPRTLNVHFRKNQLAHITSYVEQGKRDARAQFFW